MTKQKHKYCKILCRDVWRTVFFCLLVAFLRAEADSGRSKEPLVQAVHFYGLQQVSKEQAAAWFGVAENTPLRMESMTRGAEALLKGMTQLGRYFSRIDSITYLISSDSSQAYVRVYIREGRTLVQGAIQFAGLDSLQQLQMQRRMDSRPGRPLDLARLENDLDDGLKQFELKGHPFCRFDLQSLQLDSLNEKSSALSSRWNAALGPKLRLTEIQIAGNKVTKKQVILRELNLRTGALYDQRKVARIPSRLMKLGYFESVEEPRVFWTQADEGGLLLQVKEGNTSKFDGILGYIPASGDQKGYFTGLLDISLGNLMGTGRTVQAHWQKRDQKTQDLKLAYWEPWLAGLPVSAGIGFSQLIQDTTYVQREFGLNFTAPLLENLSIVGQLAQLSISPDSVGSYVLGLLNSRTNTASIGIEYDNRDDRINPRRGVFYGTSVQAGRKKNLGPADLVTALLAKTTSDNKRIFLDLEFYLPVWKRQVAAWSIHGRQIQSNEGDIPLPDLFRLGGAKTLRGYREDQFRGSAVAWTNLEWRYLLGRRSRVFLFVDGGYFLNSTASMTQNNYKLGYGFGFRLETGLGMMGVDYGLAKGEGALSGKVHVGLVNEF